MGKSNVVFAEQGQQTGRINSLIYKDNATRHYMFQMLLTMKYRGCLNLLKPLGPQSEVNPPSRGKQH